MKTAKKVNYFFILIINLIYMPSFAQHGNNRLGLIPSPVSLTPHHGNFSLSARTLIQTDSLQNKSISFLRSYLADNYQLHNEPVKSSKGYLRSNSIIHIITKRDPNSMNEGYRLQITADRINLTGNDAGIFYGIQTLIQLISREGGRYTLPCVDIVDFPRFQYRGLMLDVARHFFSVTQVEQVLDLMAHYKLNTFQWHLTDNEGWRIEIKKYPKLAAIGGYDVHTVFDGERDGLDSAVTGGYYSQEQIKEVVKYASDRFITVIPEIEMPAHSVAALRANPEFKCVLPENSPNQSANNYIYCPSEATFKFLEDILNEVIPLFPGKYIHIGGDEADKRPWEESLYCQQLMKNLNIKDVHSLQSYFIQRIEKFLISKNKHIIGWDEISEGGLSGNATVTCRFGEKAALAIIQQKHQVIMTPGLEGLYFDYYQSNSSFEPFGHEHYNGGYTPLWKSYNYDPAPALLTAEQEKYVLGVQGSIWTEHMATMNKLYYMMVPRIFALAEIAWALPKNKNTETFFEISVPKQLLYLEKREYNFRVPTAFKETDTVMIGSKFLIANNSSALDSKTYYTLSGHTPTENDRLFTAPLTFSIPKNERREIQAIVITYSGKRSVPSRIIMCNEDTLPAMHPRNLSKGLAYQIYDKDILDTTRCPHSLKSGIMQDFQLDTLKKVFGDFKIICEGYIYIAENNTYHFFISAKGGNQIYIDGKDVIADNTDFSKFELTGGAILQKGYHKIKIEYSTEPHIKSIPVYLQSGKNVKEGFSTDIIFH
ncbi:family 20 glycosylhydrolase [Mucilaginibacter sp. X4EP1]|uniref:family 20 glycosylhydrolase n=1 Tax=Mucilaginibacter sp. X4EP1 TaxID=2723092 RepID=UPI002167721A|nr:family 20 glycosylhydrolase [Mucilaginibacter sp. X4EP1]MCS3811537.1 hexosaminidase [Mucilaginibacter sp. X4EP1]